MDEGKMSPILSKVPIRVIIGLMIFTGTCINYMTRVNLSVNLVAMVPVTNNTYSDSQVTFNWTAYQRAQVLGAYFWGYVMTPVIGGSITQICGPKLMGLIIVIVNSTLTILSPLAAKYSYLALVILRVIIGFFSGMLFPAFHILISKWAADCEKGRFIGALIGGTIGTFFAWSLCGLIIGPWGWEWGFYIFGIIGFGWMVAFWFLVYDAPEKHPRITSAEKNYINLGKKQSEKGEKVKLVPPYMKLLISIPLWSLIVLSFGNGWGIYFVITAAPNYLASALGYGTASTGLLSALIYLSRSSCGFGFGYLADLCLKYKLMSLKMLRKVAAIVSHVIPGCIVLCMAIPGYGPTFYLALIMLAMGFNGAGAISCNSNPHDLSKNFVGTISGFAIMSVTVAGMVTPFVTAYFIKSDETNQLVWQPVFYVGGLVYIVTGLQFLIFGSTEKQSWDQVDTYL